VTDVVERTTLNRPAPQPFVAEHHVDGPRRSALDVRLDATRGSLDLASDRTAPLSGRGRVALDTSGVNVDGGAALNREVDGGTANTTLDGDGRWSPDGALHGRLDASHDVDVTIDDERRRTHVGGNVTRDVSADGDVSTRLSADGSHEVRTATGERRDEVRAEIDSSPDSLGGTLRHEHRRRSDGTEIEVTDNIGVRTGERGTTIDGGISGSRSTDGGANREAGNLRGSMGPDGVWSADGGASIARDLDGGSFTASGDGHVDSSGSGRGTVTVEHRSDGGLRGRHTASATWTDGIADLTADLNLDDTATDGNVTTTRSGRLGARHNATGTTVDLTASHGVRDSSTGSERDLSGAVHGGLDGDGLRGRGSVTASGASGSGADRTEWNANLDGDARDSGFTANASGRFVHGDNAGPSRTELDGAGSVSVDEGGPRGEGRVSGSFNTRLDDDDTLGLTGNARFAAHAESVTGTATLGIEHEHDSEGLTLNHSMDATLELDNDGVMGRLDLEAGGVCGPEDDPLAWGADMHVEGDLTGVDVTANAHLERGNDSSPRSWRVEGSGEVRGRAAEVNANGRAAARYRRVIGSHIHVFRGEVTTDGRMPVVGVRVESEDRDSERRDVVSGVMDFTIAEANASWEHRSRAGIAGVHEHKTSLTVNGEEGKLRVDIPTDGPGSLARAGVEGRLSSSGANLSSTATFHGAPGTGALHDVTGNMGVGRNGLAAAAKFKHRAGDGSAAGIDGKLDIGGGKLDLGVAGTREVTTSLGRLAFAIAGYTSRAETVRDLGAVDELGGKHRVVFDTLKHGELAGGGGLHLGIIGGGATARGGRFKSATWVTHMDADEARRVVLEKEVRTIPDLGDPSSLAEGDAVRIITGGDVGMSGDLSVAGISFAGRFSMRGEFSVVVEKLAGENVRISVEPRRVRTIGAEGRLLVAAAGFDYSKAKSLRQTFDLDLSTEAGRKAYADALAGDLPEARVHRGLSRTSRAVDLVEKMNEDLPDGVRAVSFAREKERRVSRSFGLTWAFFGSLKESASKRSTRETAEEGRVVTEKISGHETVHRTWFSGRQTEEVYASVAHESVDGDDGRVSTTFKNISFGARFGDEKVKGAELEKLVLRMSKLFGLRERGEGLEGFGERRDVEVKLTLDEATLEALGPLELARLVSSASRSGADEERTRKLVKDLRKSKVGADRADALREYVADERMEGLGTIARAFAHVELDLQSDTTFYGNAVEDAARLGKAWDSPVDFNNPWGFASRHKQVMAVMRNIQDYRGTVQMDPLVPEAERESIVAAFDKAEADLNGILDLSHLSQRQLRRLRSTLSMLAFGTQLDYSAVDYIDKFREGSLID
jgi:hypothetical protein